MHSEFLIKRQWGLCCIAKRNDALLRKKDKRRLIIDVDSTEDPAHGDPCEMDGAEPQLGMRPLLGNLHYVGIESHTDREEGVLRSRPCVAVRRYVNDACRLRRSREQSPRRLARVTGDSVDSGYDIGRPGGDDAQWRRGARQPVGDVVYHAIASHRHYHVKAVGNGVGGPLTGCGRIHRPDRYHLELGTERCDDIPVPRSGETRRRRVGNEEKTAHWLEARGVANGRIADTRPQTADTRRESIRRERNLKSVIWNLKSGFSDRLPARVASVCALSGSF